MRDIKFRIYNDRYKNFSYWGFNVNNLKAFTGIPTGAGITIEYAQEYSEQYTGLKDKNGVEIYEGDILEYRRSSSILTDIVIFSEGAFWCGYHQGSSTRKRIKLIQEKTVKVIGNIHEQ